MCISPNTLPNGVQIACRNCWQCAEREINDWAGRCIAESKTAVACHAVTLTYGRGERGEVLHPRSVVLTYSDVQKYLKYLRVDGYPVRYLVAGEYGSLKGRSHFHALLFWKERVPDHVLHERFMEKHWSHGWSYWEPVHVNSARYACKYLAKSLREEGGQYLLRMSKKPPIGAAYFYQLAEQHVREGLSPQTLEYRFPEARRRKKDGREEIVPYMLKGRMAELYLEHFIETWRRERGGWWPTSDLVDLFHEYGKVVSDENLLERRTGSLEARMQVRNELQRQGPMDEFDWYETWRKEQGDGQGFEQSYEEYQRAQYFERLDARKREQSEKSVKPLKGYKPYGRKRA